MPNTQLPKLVEQSVSDNRPIMNISGLPSAITVGSQSISDIGDDFYYVRTTRDKAYMRNIESDLLEQEELNEETNGRIDMTLPGHNYMGPGTKFLSNIHNKTLPVDEADYLSMMHDYAYTKAKNQEDLIEADMKFQENAKDLESNIAAKILRIKAGLTALNPHDTANDNQQLNAGQIKQLDREMSEIIKTYNERMEYYKQHQPDKLRHG